MNNSFCKKIDKELLVEKYVAGELSGSLLTEFEKHIASCKKHARAVSLEKIIKKGISAFARNEMKLRIRKRIQKSIETRYMMLKVAAILFIVTITPLILYYHFHLDQSAKMIEQDLTGQVKKEIAHPDSLKAEEPVPQTVIDNMIIKDVDRILSGESKKSIARNQAEKKKQLPAPSIGTFSAKSAGTLGKQDEEVIPAAIPPEKIDEHLLVSEVKEVAEAEQLPAPERNLDKSQRTGRGMQSRLSVSEARDKGAGETEISAVAKNEIAAEKEELSYDDSSAGKKIDQFELPLLQQLALHDPEINNCFDQSKELIADDSLEVNVELIILPDGLVEVVKIIDNKTNLEKMNDCIIKTILNCKFSQQENKVYLKKKYLFRKMKKDAGQLK
jgi:hypothetical protein